MAKIKESIVKGAGSISDNYVFPGDRALMVAHWLEVLKNKADKAATVVKVIPVLRGASTRTTVTTSVPSALNITSTTRTPATTINVAPAVHGRLGPISHRSPTDEDVEIDLSSQHTNFESLDYSESGDLEVQGFKGTVNGRIVYVDNLEVPGYNFQAEDGTTVIVIRRGRFEQEARFHEVREAYWISQGFSPREAHVIAWAEQVQEFALKHNRPMTAYQEAQLADPRVRNSVLSESEKDRYWHYGILAIANKYHAAGINIAQIREFERNLRREIHKQDISSSQPLDQGSAQAPVVSSSVVNPGGIDFRFLPIIVQSYNNLRLGIHSISLDKVQNINLTQELEDMQKMTAVGIQPSCERIKECIQVSCLKERLGEDMPAIISLIANTLRLEEENLSKADPTLRDILVVLESKSIPELNSLFSNQS